MTYGVTAEGFNAKTLETILAEIEADELTGLDPALDVSPESVIGKLNAVMASKLRELWELAAIVYSARDRANASFATLDAIAALTGSTRAQATKGAVALTLTVGPNATVPAGSIAAVAGQPTNRWVTRTDAVNGTGFAADIDVLADAETAGRITANAGTITVIATPATGWLAVTNASDAAPGTDRDTDAQLRLRSEQELAAQGSSGLPSIASDLLALVDAQGARLLAAVLVEENASSFPDSFGRPPHTIEVLAQFAPTLSGDALTAARWTLTETIFASKAGGIDTVGSRSTLVLDPLGAEHVVRWSEPTPVPIYVEVVLSIDPDAYAGDASVATAIVAWGAGQKLGGTVIRTRLLVAILQVPGVLDVGSLKIGTDPGTLQEANIAVSRRELATFDTGDVTVFA